jgi:hypothetical protein
MTVKLTEAQARQWLARTVRLVNEMAQEDIAFDGHEDPGELMNELADALGLAESDNPWDDAVSALGVPQ